MHRNSRKGAVITLEKEGWLICSCVRGTVARSTLTACGHAKVRQMAGRALGLGQGPRGPPHGRPFPSRRRPAPVGPPPDDSRLTRALRRPSGHGDPRAGAPRVRPEVTRAAPGPGRRSPLLLPSCSLSDLLQEPAGRERGKGEVFLRKPWPALWVHLIEARH